MSKILIGMPVYNGERFIEESLNSLVNQSFTDWSILISDDTSTDSTQKICEKFAATDKRITYVRQEKNLGMFSNFKFVMDAANTEYFMWAAQDDIWEKNFLNVSVGHLENDRSLGMAMTCMIEIDSFSRNVRELPWLRHFSGKPSFYRIARYVLEPEILGKCNLMYGLFKTEALKEVWRIYPQRDVWGQDYMFALALISHFPVMIDREMLFKKRYGGFSNPKSNDNDDEKTVQQMYYKQPKNLMFPFGRARGYIEGHMEALKKTRYRPMVLILLLARLPRAFIIHLSQRNIMKKIKEICKKSPFGKTYIHLRNVNKKR